MKKKKINYILEIRKHYYNQLSVHIYCNMLDTFDSTYFIKKVEEHFLYNIPLIACAIKVD